uniref:Uncharacterized protein n=1 Tax=Trieres chinensis TaxID=1514140 RepID=A0A7S2EBY3_TRICV
MARLHSDGKLEKIDPEEMKKMMGGDFAKWRDDEDPKPPNNVEFAMGNVNFKDPRRPAGDERGGGGDQRWDADKIKLGLEKMAEGRSKEEFRRMIKEERKNREGGPRPPDAEERARRRRRDHDLAGKDVGAEDATAQQKRSFRERYESDDFGGASKFSTRGYAAGIVIMALFVVFVERHARMADRRWNKGARIL